MRVVAYIRVSNESQVEQFSLDAQRHAIAQHAARHGWTIGEHFIDAGHSAFTDDPAARPAFAALLAQVDEGLWDVVIVARLDRFARSIIVAVSQLKRLRAAGCALVDVASQIDYSSSTGQFVYGIQSLIAENESRNIGDRTRAGIAQKRRAGGHHGGIPYGALRDATGRLRLDPATAPTLARILTLAATDSYGRVAAALNADGIPSPRGATWQPSPVRHLIRHGRWLLDQPDPWPALWSAAYTRPRVPAVNWRHNPAMLSGLLRCACGGTIQYVSKRRTPDGERRYLSIQCRRFDAARPTGGYCPHRKRGALHYEALVTDWLAALPDLRGVRRTARPDAAAALADLAERRAIAGVLLDGRSIATAEYKRRIAEIDAAELALRLPRVASETLAREIMAARALWPDATPGEQNAALRRLCERLIVTGPRLTVVPVPALRELLDRAGGVSCDLG